MSESKKIDQIQEKVDSVAETVCKIDKAQALTQAALESHTKQDEQMYDELKRMNDILQHNTDSLKEHMQNNVLLKDMIVNMNKRLEPIEIEFIQKTAVKNWVMTKIKFLGKLGLALAALDLMWVYLHPFLTSLLK